MLTWQLGMVILLALASMPTLVFVLQIFSARLQGKDFVAGLSPCPTSPCRWVVLVPAHNEEAVVSATLQPLLQVAPALRCRVVVVADNCDDGTAALCRQLGAEVIERRSDTDRGKGYALQFGMDYLAAHDPPDVVVVLDADCTASSEGLQTLARASFELGLPHQSAYLMHARPGASVAAKVSEFAWVVKTLVRPLGWGRLAGQGQLLGSGMAFPWAVISRFNLASGHLVEDLKLTADFAKTGIRVRFFPSVRVDSCFPTASASRTVQSKRWEHGHLGMIVSEVPALLWNAVRSRNAPALVLALDLMVPPLSLLVLWVCLMALVEGVWAFFSSDAFWFAEWAAVLFLMIAAAVGRAWSGWGRDILTPRELLQIPRFVLTKLGIYRGFLVKREKNWNRSDRD